MQDPFPTIRGVPFWPLGHHDGRFVRTPGLYAFARRQPNGRFLVLHLGLADAINRDAVVGHPRWSWALGQRMDSLLVHLFGARVALPGGITSDIDTVDWHPDASVDLPTFQVAPDAEIEPLRRGASSQA